MKLVSIENVPGYYKSTGNKQIIDEFIESGMQCAEVEDYPQKKATYCVSSLSQTIKRYRVFNVRAIQRKDRVFLIRDEI